MLNCGPEFDSGLINYSGGDSELYCDRARHVCTVAMINGTALVYSDCAERCRVACITYKAFELIRLGDHWHAISNPDRLA